MNIEKTEEILSRYEDKIAQRRTIKHHSKKHKIKIHDTSYLNIPQDKKQKN